MSVEPNDLWLFARVVDEGSFTRAAERLGLPKSTVSRRISALEQRFGERLLLRTTRKLSLTDLGRSVLDHARQLAAEVDAATSLAEHRQARPTGRLRVSLPGELPGIDLPRLFAELLERNPGIELEIDVSSRRVDLIGEGFDLAIRMGELPDDATLVARRLFTHEWGLYAAPGYLAVCGSPRTPEDLMDGHAAIALRGPTGEPLPWLLLREDERWSGLPPRRVLANRPDLMAQLAAEGVGVTAVPTVAAARAVASRRLVRVLPEWCLPSTPGWAVMPGRRLLPAKTRVFLEILDDAIRRSGSAAAG